jgi:phosphoribosylglycinamide formyltransferase
MTAKKRLAVEILPSKRSTCCRCANTSERGEGRERREGSSRVILGPPGNACLIRRHPAGHALRAFALNRSGGEIGAECEGKDGTKRLAVFASGGGSNFRALHAAIVGGKINGTIELVVSDKASCGATEYAAEHGIACLKYPDRSQEDGGLQGLLTALEKEHAIDFVILAGYMKLIPPELVRAFERGVLNMHPALLPAFGGKGYYGIRVHEAVVQSGARFSGATVHFVDEEYDRGPIVAQACVPVSPWDTAQDLAARVLKSEHELYPHVVAALCDNRIKWTEDNTKPVIWTAT